MQYKYLINKNNKMLDNLKLYRYDNLDELSRYINSDKKIKKINQSYNKPKGNFLTKTICYIFYYRDYKLYYNDDCFQPKE